MNFNDEKKNLPRLYISTKVEEDVQIPPDINSPQKTTIKKMNPLFYNKQTAESRNHFCTIVGTEYVVKIIALQKSLLKSAQKFTLWICCIDSVAYSILKGMNLINVNLLPVDDVEDENLKEIKKKRKVNEYCWTLKSILIEYLLVNYDLPSVLYCDGDLCFFSDPNTIFEEWGENSIFLCPQRDRDWVEEKYGKYQAGLIGFKNDLYGLKGVRWWKEKCLNWCSAEPDNGRFGDQKYLDFIPIYFPKVKISQNLGINAAPWNCIYNNDYKIYKNQGDVYIETDKLIVYHFACITIFSEKDFDLWSLGEISIPNNILNHIYTPYLELIQFILKGLKEKFGGNIKQLLSAKDINKAQTLYKDSQLRRKMNQSNYSMNYAMIISRERLIQGLTCYYSLESHSENFTIWICCMDDVTYRMLTNLKLKHAILIHVKDIENQELLSMKNERSLQEYCWTLKAPLCLHILNYYSEVDHIVYCDADMYFFTKPNIILDEWWKYSVFLCPQRGTTELENVHGIYQAGLIGFKNDSNSKDILRWWKDKCLEYCKNVYDIEMNRWGDQKYLDYIPNIFSNIKVMTHKGIDAAPWNVILNNSPSITKVEDKIFIDQDELIAFHFGSMQIINTNKFDLWKQESIEMDQSILKYIYIPYIEKIRKTCLLLYNAFGDSLTPLFTRPVDESSIKNYLQYSSLQLR
ncbi:glycosyl transferase [Bacillus pseudomycoides]|uniref:Glycosyl transferase n=1 Tax=Bacillus pseudomycoides TaxID=64104 RepID=A0AA91VC65_9BACI|nr:MULTISPECIES: glycosyl transferase [Bacillus]PEB47520.1 glycosyl transferase [Bacillus sp. AFS098217]PED82561.1 glycosyl transferase [Bacillus pseudomycoides]PEU08511.1 glycosyl transferase [Bacillus sp. AFS014408]PEU17244.1 glycosyl transferase [Bacillus sp. AFS019443]PFW61183.1 glycosyl transferase [Bacillus sp. AFS075034]